MVLEKFVNVIAYCCGDDNNNDNNNIDNNDSDTLRIIHYLHAKKKYIMQM